jgi:hypothetical protein
MPNTELGYRVLDYIEAHPQEWDQRIYLRKDHCGTAACFAGWAVLLSGDQPDWSEGWPAEVGDTFSGEATDTVRVVSDGALDGVGARATDLLDITGEAAADLFAASNDLDDLRTLTAEIFGERPA